jgi:hypothetical protein
VRGSVNSARTATAFGLSLFVFFMFVDLFLLPFAGPRQQNAVVELLKIMGFAMMLPAAVHLVSHVGCVAVPRSHGGDVARLSAALLGFSVIAGVLLLEYRGHAVVASACVVLALVSFGVWLVFLDRLGGHLGDDDLKLAARSYTLWFWFGLIQSAVLLGGAYFASREGLGPLAWFGRAAAGAIGFVLLRGYADLLRRAVRAIDLRAPLAPRR